MNLQKLLLELSNYFLMTQITPAGRYWSVADQDYCDIENDQLTISRPKDDWCLVVWEVGSHLIVGLAECYSGGEVFRSCLLPGQEVLGILELVKTAQTIVEAP